MKKILCLIVILIVYRAIFINPELIGGDWPYYFKEYLDTFDLPSIWNPAWPTGLGGNQAIILPLKLYLHLVVTVFVNTLGVPWPLVQKVFFFWLFLGLTIYSSYQFTKSWIGVLIYTTNTWILMVLSGGQIGIALAYAMAPLVLSQAIESIKYKVLSIKYVSIGGLILAIQVMFDIRVAFLTMLVFLGYSIFHHFSVDRLNLRNFIIHYSLFIILTLLLHSFWILPSVLIALKGGSVASFVDTTSASLEFFSFAKFENSLSLLHPNWPENIFGKVSFMKPEFIIIPILAFGSLLFLDSRTIKQSNNSRSILFFAIVGLLGAFLAKGTQEPFGFVFSFLNSNIPGFNLFRDPVKFYILIALAYSVLIPYSIKVIANKNISKFFAYSFIVFWLVLNIPLITNPIGIFKEKKIPSEYIKLNEFISGQDEFFRTLWYPSYQRFGHQSENHPPISSQDIFKKRRLEERILSDMSVKYIIVPYDSEGEVFLNDRKYDDRLYQKTIAELSKITWLKKVEDFGKITVFELSDPRPHRFSKDNKLIFSESYDKFWYAETQGTKVYSKPYGRLNSFDIPQNQQSSVKLLYEPQKWATIGYLISGLTMISTLVAIGISLRRK